MSDNDAGLSIIYTGGYVHDLAICINPTDWAYGWLLARNPLDGRWVRLTKIGANATALYESRARIAELEAALAAERAWRGSSAPEDIARRFHDAYEHFAPQFGYATRPESRKEWDELPQNLRDLMIAVVRNVLIEWPAAERERREDAEWVLKEIRIRLHAAGRRPEECWEMSEIDGYLAQFGRHKD